MLIAIADAFLVFFAAWTVVEQLSYLFGLSFAQGWLLACSTGVLGVGYFYFVTGFDGRAEYPPAEQASDLMAPDVPPAESSGSRANLAQLCVRHPGQPGTRIRQGRAFRTINWIASRLTLVPRSHAAIASQRFKSDESASRWTAACWATAIGAAAVTMCLHRPDADDNVYLGNSVYALDHLDVSIRTLTVLANGYVLTSYDFFRAAFSWLTGIPILVSYYIIWPAFLALFVVVFQFRLFRLAGVTNMILASVVFFVVMLAWGDVHRTPANFGFVRLFQGKGPLIWLAIPAALYYWLRYMQRNEAGPLFLLYCAIVAGVGFSPTGVLTGLLLAGLFGVATLANGGFARASWRPAIAIGLAGAYPLAIGLVMRYFFGHSSQGVHTAEGILDSVNNAEMLKSTLLGNNVRGAMALLAVLAAPFLLQRSVGTSPLRVYFWICIVLLLFPWTSEVFAKLGFMTFSWRWFYVLPFGLSMVVAADRLGRSDLPTSARFALVTLALAVFVFSSSRWVLSPENYTELRLPGFKLPNTTEAFLAQYNSIAKIEGVWLISPATARRL